MKLSTVENIFIIIASIVGIFAASWGLIFKDFHFKYFILTIIFCGNALLFSVAGFLSKGKFNDIPIFGKRNRMQGMVYLLTGAVFGFCMLYAGIFLESGTISRTFLIGGGIIFIIGSIFSFYVLSKGVGLNKISKESLDMMNARLAQSKKTRERILLVIFILTVLFYFFVLRRFM